MEPRGRKSGGLAGGGAPSASIPVLKLKYRITTSVVASTRAVESSCPINTKYQSVRQGRRAMSARTLPFGRKSGVGNEDLVGEVKSGQRQLL